MGVGGRVGVVPRGRRFFQLCHLLEDGSLVQVGRLAALEDLVLDSGGGGQEVAAAGGNRRVDTEER